MATEQSIRSYVKRLLSSGSLYDGKHSPKRRHESRCTCDEQAQSFPARHCPEHFSRGLFRSLGGPEYSRLSADALRELETDVERGIGRNSSPEDDRVPSNSANAPPSIKLKYSQDKAPANNSDPTDMDIARRASLCFSAGIIPLTNSSTASASYSIVLPKVRTSVTPPKSPTPHYSHFRRRKGFANGDVRASGRVAEVERDSLAKDKETLERLAAGKEAGPSGREDALEAGTDFISVTTFNILAPIYKRVSGDGERESADEARWKKRNQEIVELLLTKRSSIICLQVDSAASMLPFLMPFCQSVLFNPPTRGGVVIGARSSKHFCC